MARWIVALVSVSVGLGLVVVCSADPVASVEYQELEAEARSLEQSAISLQQQVAELEDELAALTGERNQLVAESEADAARYATVLEFTELRNQVARDPSAYGTEEEVLDLLSSGAAPGAVMDDEVFGGFQLRQAWKNTLFAGSVDAVTTEWRSWICSDGRLGGSLWTWEGTNRGKEFSLVGINLNQHDDDGLLVRSTVIYPYTREFVVDEFVR